jgi:hypothetical protein
MASLRRGGVIGAVATTKVADSLGFPTKVGLDGLLAGGILGGNVQELPRCARGLMAEHVDEHLAGHAVDEGVDHIGINDVWELIVLLREALNVIPEGLVICLLAVAEIPGVPWAGVGTLEVVDEDCIRDAAGLKLLEPSSD